MNAASALAANGVVPHWRTTTYCYTHLRAERIITIEKDLHRPDVWYAQTVCGEHKHIASCYENVHAIRGQ